MVLSFTKLIVGIKFAFPLSTDIIPKMEDEIIRIYIFLGSKILPFTLLLMSLALLLTGVGYQLHQKRQEVLCHAHLRHWGTAFHIYYARQNREWKLPPSLSPEQWLTEVESSLYDPAVTQCPAVVCPQGFYSYKVNRNVLPNLHPLFSGSFPKNTVLLFDGIPDERRITTSQPPYAEVANRHLEGANLLFLDGSVVYHRAYSQGRGDESGWRDSEGYQWSFP